MVIETLNIVKIPWMERNSPVNMDTEKAFGKYRKGE